MEFGVVGGVQPQKSSVVAYSPVFPLCRSIALLISAANVGLTRELCRSSLRRPSFLNTRSLPSPIVYPSFSFVRSLAHNTARDIRRSLTSFRSDHHAGLKFMNRS